MTELVKADAREARERAARIRIGMVSYLSTLADIAAAYAARDWSALGYDSWQSYIDGEYSEARLRLPADHRAKAVAELRMAGMSTRAIGAAVGVSEGTVRNDLASAGAQDYAPDEITGADGKRYAASSPVVEAVRDSIERATEKAAEKAQIREQYDQLREDLAAIPPETVNEIMRATQPTVDLRRITQACRDLVTAFRGINPLSAAAGDCDADELRAIDDAIDLLTTLHNALGVPA